MAASGSPGARQVDLVYISLRVYWQNRILETLSAADDIASVSALLESGDFPNRTALAHRVCEDFRFFDALGRPQIATFLTALRTLEARNLIHLPSPSHRGRLGRPHPSPIHVPDRVERVAEPHLNLPLDPATRQVCNELIASERTQGAAIHVGAQSRHLIRSGHGILGAIGFPA